MRLFTAVELTDDARAVIVAEQQRLLSGLVSSGAVLKVVRPEHLHLTLVFIGEVDDDRAAAVVAAMQERLAVRPFRLTFGGIGAFPPRGAPRVLFIDAAEGRDAVVELYRSVADRLADAGVERESRPYFPHLTLGRWRASRPSDRPRVTGGSRVAAMDVRQAVLFQSRSSPSGPVYTRLAAARLEP